MSAANKIKNVIHQRKRAKMIQDKNDACKDLLLAFFLIKVIMRLYLSLSSSVKSRCILYFVKSRCILYFLKSRCFLYFVKSRCFLYLRSLLYYLFLLQWPHKTKEIDREMIISSLNWALCLALEVRFSKHDTDPPHFINEFYKTC